MKIIHNSGACYGCRTCELVCSYHHRGAFCPEFSSIKILTFMRTGEIYWNIDSSCDSCEGEKEPLCVEYCAYGALKVGK